MTVFVGDRRTFFLGLKAFSSFSRANLIDSSLTLKVVQMFGRAWASVRDIPGATRTDSGDELFNSVSRLASIKSSSGSCRNGRRRILFTVGRLFGLLLSIVASRDFNSLFTCSGNSFAGWGFARTCACIDLKSWPLKGLFNVKHSKMMHPKLQMSDAGV